ncbi:STAS/SEC14 domain-containing protein [Christiangramia fulva]|uniref:STAS/SEC14 domain-containing protein n=1 Tax=Christiangramia fulva TaxID=2126553 RepID=A0A2R3Z8H2_9FLAO|nr:STAS/SEC14 domain-containing protein [Christiangramia fulva]AVR46559.1 STAS/SEC14 domain-containing protein [Christiangramia fulva]
MIQILNSGNEQVIAVKITGTINEKDVQKIHPLIHNIRNKGLKVRWYLELENFTGYTLSGLWEDLKVDAAHSKEYGKMVMVGDKKWQELATGATEFFTSSEVRFFEPRLKEQAKQWINK